MSNSVYPDDDEPSHLDLRCLQKPVIIAYGSERVRYIFYLFMKIYVMGTQYKHL